MRKKRTSIVCCIMAILMAGILSLSGCGFFEFGGGGGTSSVAPKTYTIQYTDDAGTHTLEVEDGSPYSLESIPRREGYDFIGLFDAEAGGTQYVLANGSSVSPFTDKQNMVLFPQYKAKQYTVILDYGGAAITGERQVEVSYGESLPELPKNLTLDHSTFSGWYTAANCGGVQVADEYGLVPVVSVVNSDNFDLTGEYITLYAGFETETFTVTFNFGNGIQPEEMQIAYNTPISQVVPETRNSDGKAVLSWSKTSSGDQIFTGNITDDTVLYAVEWAPVIELDPNGGETIAPVVAREGTTVALPTPVRENYKFLHWETMSGEEANITKMPADGAQLKAVWQAMLVFDENGGTEVKDISQEAGTAITLPTPEKEGFIFAGWYNADEEKYESKSMPAASVALKAGWYKTKETEIVLRSAEEDSFNFNWTYNIIVNESNTSKGPGQNGRISVDLSEFVPETGGQINITLHWRMQASHTGFSGGFYFYNNSTVSDAYYIDRVIEDVPVDAWEDYTCSKNLSLTGNTLYVFYYGKSGPTKPDGYSNALLWFANIWAEIKYPDTTNLYL